MKKSADFDTNCSENWRNCSRMKSLYHIFFFLCLVLLISHSSCSHSGKGETKNTNEAPFEPLRNRNSGEKTVVRMDNENGVKYGWIEINGLRLRFIFDTSASSICISSAEATVLYRQGTLQKEDILDTQYFQDATGKISTGTSINLRTVKIGERILENVEATVIDNTEAPLLLGQTALEQFGKISIDNNRGEITFE